MVTRLKYRMTGTCLWCPKPRHTENNKTYSLCTKHMNEQRQNSAKRSDRPKQGLCRRCRNPVKPNKTMCEYHLAYERNRVMKNRTNGDKA